MSRTFRFPPPALFFGFLLLYHLNGDFLVGRDPMATVHLPLSVLGDGDLALTPDEAPQMFSWTYRGRHGEHKVRFESWDEKAGNLVVWSSNRTAPLGLVEPGLSPQTTAGQLRAAGRLTPLAADYYLVPAVSRGQKASGIAEVRGHNTGREDSRSVKKRLYVNTFGPGAGLVALPLAAAASLVVDDLAENKAVLWYGAKFVAACCVAASVTLVYLAARELTAAGAAFLVALAYGAGTCAWSVASQTLWQSGPNVMFLALAAWCLVRWKKKATGIALQGDLPAPGRLGSEAVACLPPACRDGWAAGCGLAVACGVVCRPTSALVVVAIGLYLAAVAWRRWRGNEGEPGAVERVPFRIAVRPLALYAAAGLPLAVWQAYHNWYYLGAPWIFGDMVASRELAIGKVGTPDVWSGSWFEGFYGLLASPSRGMLVFSPVLLFAWWGAIQVWRDRQWAVLRPLSLAAALMLGLSAKWYDWAGGWSFGYRLMIDALPLLALCSMAVVDQVRRRRAWQALLAATLAWSVAVQVIGAWAYDVTGWNNRRAYVVKLPGQERTLVFDDAATAQAQAARSHATVRPIHLNIDLKSHHRRLWSIADSPLVYYLTHFTESRANKKRMIEAFLGERDDGCNDQDG